MVNQDNQSPVTSLVPMPPGLSLAEQQCWDRQDMVIEAYRSRGTLSKATEAVGLTPDAAYSWQKSDTHGFNQRMEYGRQGYRDFLENLVHERLKDPTGNRGSDVLLMGALNANHPDKWSRNIQVTHEVGREVMATLQKIQEQQKQAPALPEAAMQPWVLEHRAAGETEEKPDGE